MAKVIKRVKSEVVEEVLTGIQCDSCGCGWSNRFTEQACDNPSCSGTMRPYEQRFTRSIPGYVVVRCACRREVVCQGFTSGCECGCEYNWNGTELAPRCQWGEETGEVF